MDRQAHTPKASSKYVLKRHTIPLGVVRDKFIYEFIEKVDIFIEFYYQLLLISIMSYTQNELLDRVYTKLNERDDTKTVKTLAIAQPVVARNNQFTVVRNYRNIDFTFEKYSINLRKYIEDELSVSTTVNAEGELSIRGRLTKDKLTSVFKKLVMEQIECPICHSYDTKYRTTKGIKKLECNACHSVRIK